jgi:hypothetical protein
MFNVGKDVENRSWATRIRGRVLIHAAATITQDEWNDAWDFSKPMRHQSHPLISIPDIGWFRSKAGGASFLEGAACGGIVGEVEIVDCVTMSVSPWFVGPYGFVLRNVKPLPFRPLKGRLGFFEVDEVWLYGGRHDLFL